MGKLLVVEVDDVGARDHPRGLSQAELAEAEVVVLVDPLRQESRMWKWRGAEQPSPYYSVAPESRAGRLRILARAVLTELEREVRRQDEIHPQGYGIGRDAVRLGLASADDELGEALRAWDDEKHGTAHWPRTGEEALTAAGVIVRLLRDMEWRRNA